MKEVKEEEEEEEKIKQDNNKNNTSIFVDIKCDKLDNKTVKQQVIPGLLMIRIVRWSFCDISGNRKTSS